MTGKRHKALVESYDGNAVFPVKDAISLAKKNANAKFDETLEISINLGVDPKHSDQIVRTMISLPKGTGKKVTVAVFAKDDKAKEAEAAGADIVGSDDLIEKVQKGEVNFDRCIATPDMMPVIGKVAKILGPKGLMPNPKLGTVTDNVKDAVTAAKGGQVELRTEKAGIVHSIFGKASFSEADLEQNLRVVFEEIQNAKPSGAKGTYIKSAVVTSSMGAAIKLDIEDAKTAA